MRSTILKNLKELQAAAGSKAKIAILEKIKADPKSRHEFETFAFLTLEPTISYYMTELPEGHKQLVESVQYKTDIEVLTNISQQLSQRKVTGFAAKQFVLNEMMNLDAEGRELLFYMINRSLKAGIEASTFNKVFTNCITLVPYRRCVLPKDSNIKNWPWGQPGFYAYSQLKADGSYANVNVDIDKNTVIVESRNGTVYAPVSIMQNIVNQALIMATSLYARSMQFHGELLVYVNGKVMPRAEGNGILNSIIQTGEDPEGSYEVRFSVWGSIPLEKAVHKGSHDEEYHVCFDNLQKAVDLTSHLNGIQLIESKKVSTMKEAMEHFRELVGRGEEGTVWKHMSATWKDGDDKFQVKGKLEAECDMRIVGFLPADPNSKHKATFGSLLVESEDGLCQTGVTGMSDQLRKKLHEERDFYMGRIVPLVFNDITYSRDLTKQKHSLFLPRLADGPRLDKTQADSFLKIVDALESAKTGTNL